jgi:glutathione synthase/RimK-type ligase-like ATP-grasp enzyme
MSDQLLILTSQSDRHADAVIKELADRRCGVDVIRINTDRLSTSLDYKFHWTDNGELQSQLLTALDSGVTAKNVRVVWYRKPEDSPPHPALTDPIAQNCSVLEYREFLRSFAGLFPEAKWVNDYWQMQRYSIKTTQFQVAKKARLAVPETLMTNRLCEVRALADRHPEIIHKPMAFRHFRWGDDYYFCFTHLLTKDELSSLTDADVQYAPAVYQQRIHKARELRVTVVGERVFGCEIKTQPETLQAVDSRMDAWAGELPYAAVDVPLELQRQLVEVLRLMGLNFGTFDLIQDASGTYYFLEVNPNGQYYRFELKTGLPITSAMVDLIVTLAGAAAEA